MLVYQRVNLHFPMVFPLKLPFSYGFPMVFMAALSRPVLRARHHRHGKAHQSEPRRKLQALRKGISGEQTEKKQTFIIIYIYIYMFIIYIYIYTVRL